MEKIKTIILKLFNKIEFSFSSESSQKKHNNFGALEYENDGFVIKDKYLSVDIKWDDINKIEVYKKDLFTVDLIVMEITHDEKILVIDEKLPGWFQFILKLKEIFSEIPRDWDLTIMNPAFEKNYRVLFEKKV
ncbi:hypothetical protein [Flavobacterium hibernum]|uniref:Uncharacterized protein n=1 Tax=Flavobacterium hibernum TaxID=37752 RepID=A0A0D0EF67_9FLAO|nr:hypothetical protein [Flavobacterium hibernum]KIO53574.1 hypothetical protein IW18_07185 [Flavobacterium hibernum]OXA84417.1 hypothetical protein B0A73_19675 [Flavobacterium hibernum]STO10173.1 Uncharacterised protein [Flavobacterium hibernum]